MADADPQIRSIADRTRVIDSIQEVAPPAPGRRRWPRLVLMLLVPALVAAGALYFYLGSCRYISTDNAYVEQDVVSISPDVSGRIVDVRVGENQRVHRGDVLFVIDPKPYRNALDRRTRRSPRRASTCPRRRPTR